MQITRRALYGAAAGLSTVLVAIGFRNYALGPIRPAAAAEPSIDELMVPGPLGDEAQGKPDAPTTLIEYASMTCPHCANFAINVYPVLKSRYIDTGQVRYILREFPLDSL